MDNTSASLDDGSLPAPADGWLCIDNNCQNWRHDVVALIDSAGEMVEQARYEAYGTPIGMPLGDVDMNGRVTSADTNQIRISKNEEF